MVTVGSNVKLWRVGREVGPLDVDPKFQGAGRFDDPTRLVGVLYSADGRRTCLLELIAAWAESPELKEIQQRIPAPTTAEEERDAARDREIANSPRRVPPRLYERVYLSFAVDPPLEICDLLDVATRTHLARDLTIACELRRYDFTELDKGAILSPHRPLTQAITQAIIRSAEGAGIRSESRHDGHVFNFFVGDRFQPQFVPTMNPERLTAEHPDLLSVAADLGLTV